MTAEITVRRMDFGFSDEIPRWWWMNDPYFTHAINGLNLVFPKGERFFVRSVMHYRDQLAPALMTRVRRFAGQEAQHGHQHTMAFSVLEGQGYEIASFLDWYDRLAFGIFERVSPPLLRLSVTVALEHFTAILAEEALLTNRFADAHPAMRDLLMWHSAEEIEHKAVAFDVYRAVGGGYLVRLLGLLMAAGLLMFFWAAGARHLRRQDGLTRAGRRDARARAQQLGLESDWLRRGIRSYLSPSFHPDQVDNYHLAQEHFASKGEVASTAG